MNIMRRIAVITGTRAEYGIFKPVLKKICAHPQLELSLIVVGMHFLEEFGYTVEEIEKDGFTIDAQIKGLYTEDERVNMAQSVGKGICELAEAFHRVAPDVLLVLGDRGEMLAGAVAAVYMGIPVAHIHGGELSGSIDGIVRHAITKLAHIHFPATEKSAQRIIQMGENPDYVFVVGAPGLDSIVHERLTEPEILQHKYKIDVAEPFIMVVQHPVTLEVDKAADQMRETLHAVADFKLPAIVVYPNADAGGRKMIDVIKEYTSPLIHAFESISHTDYLSLLKRTRVVVGNSSSSIIEAPSFGVPVVNVGTRQNGRERAENVIDVQYDAQSIKKGIEKALYNTAFREKARTCKNPYGDGNASSRIVKLLSTIPIETLEKRLMYP